MNVTSLGGTPKAHGTSLGGTPKARATGLGGTPKARRAEMSPAEERVARETGLLPWLVAEAVCAEAARLLGSEEPYRYAPRLAARAVQLYAVNAPFARRLRAPGERGREHLRAFLRHWLAARLARDHRALYHRLPPAYSVGQWEK